MYDSNVSVKGVSKVLESEVDIRGTLDDGAIARWISSLEQLLYTDIIKDYRTATVNLIDDERFDLDDITPDDDSRAVTFDDIVKVYDETDELVKCSPIAAHQFAEEKAIYWHEGNVCYAKLLRDGVTQLRVIYRAHPSIKVGDSDDTVKVPYEWLEMILSKVRGEAYKIAGDDAQAAKWLNDYNTQLESFKAWIAERQKWFGE